MRRAIAMFVLLLALSSTSRAGTRRSWDNVERLNPGAPLRVLLWNGEKLHGLLVSASDRGLRLDVYPRFPGRSGRVRDVKRQEIRKIVLVRAEQDLPDPGRWAKRGAIVGGAAGLGLGIFRDSRDRASCEGLCWLVDGVAGAGAGYMGGLFSAGFVGIGHLFRHGKVVYEDKAGRAAHHEAPHK